MHLAPVFLPDALVRLPAAPAIVLLCPVYPFQRLGVGQIIVVYRLSVSLRPMPRTPDEVGGLAGERRERFVVRGASYLPEPQVFTVPAVSGGAFTSPVVSPYFTFPT